MSFSIELSSSYRINELNDESVVQESESKIDPVVSKAMVYIGEGVDSTSSMAVSGRLKKFLGTPSSVYEFRDTSYIEKFIKTCAKEYDPLTFVVPGGHTVEIASSLFTKRRGLFSQIRESVCSGDMNYLGICAGANLACKDLSIYYKGSYVKFMAYADKVSSVKPLFLLNVEARSPSYLGVDKKGKAALIQDNQSLDSYHVYWNQGSTFHLQNEDTEILARYSDLPASPASIIRGKYGFGEVVLSAVHPEIDAGVFSDLEKKNDECRFDFVRDLTLSQQKQELLINSLFTSVMVDNQQYSFCF